MFRESLVDVALNRLSSYFNHHLVVRPPASVDEVAQLEHVVGVLPREFRIFLATCNGLRVDVREPTTETRIWHAHEITASVLGATGPAVPSGLAPVRGDPTGDRDWVLTARGPAEGGVIRWNPWIPGVDLIASDFGQYLHSWAEYLERCYRPDGQPIGPRRERPSFDGLLCETSDDRLRQLRLDPRVHEWLHEIDSAVACGDDFE